MTGRNPANGALFVHDHPRNSQGPRTLIPQNPPALVLMSSQVAVSFIVFQWGAAKISAAYDSHSWGEAEGSTVSNRFIHKFFQDAATYWFLIGE